MVASPTSAQPSQQHARVHGSPGEHPRLAGLLRALGPLLLAVFLAGLIIGLAIPQRPLTPAAAGALFLALAGSFAISVQSGRTRLASYLKGARGEEAVAHELAFLPATFTVFHGLTARRGVVTLQGGDFDHVVVGPTGVFVIETKNWSGVISVRDGRVLYNGTEPDRPPLDQVKQAASALRHHLATAGGRDVAVQPVLCFAVSSVEGSIGGAAGVRLCNARSLHSVLQEPPEKPLGNADQSAAVDALRKLMA